MAISPIQNFATSVLSGTQASVTSTVTATAASSAVQDESNISVSSATPSTLLSASNLQSSSVGLAQLSSVLELAQSGTQQVGSILAQLQSLAGVAQNGGPPSALASLDSEFQALLQQIDQTAAGTNFGGSNLLDGTASGATSGSGASAGSSLSIPNLSTQGLFGSAALSITTVEGANNASAAIGIAIGTVNTTSQSISDTQGEVGFASANVDTAIANNVASTSVLTEGDLAGTVVQDSFLSSPVAAATAQTTNLPPTLLSLLQE